MTFEQYMLFCAGWISAHKSMLEKVTDVSAPDRKSAQDAWDEMNSNLAKELANQRDLARN